MYPSDADARTAVLAILQVVAAVLEDHRDGDPREVSDAARQLRDALIVDIAATRPRDMWPTTDAFVTAIEQALAEHPWGRAFQQPVSEPVTAVKAEHLWMVSA